MTSLQASAAAETLTADAMPPALLAECDARAEPFARYAPPIAEAAAALIRLGVFMEREFHDARIGLCDLKRARGPLAATSCEDGVILLDAQFADPGQTLPLRVTLAHEMKHHLQHAEKKARFGEAYCAGAQYGADKQELEAEADAFGDNVAGLLVLGRAVEIVNACDAAVLIYLEADDPAAIRDAAASFQRAPAKTAVISPERAFSGKVRFFAQSAPKDGQFHVWREGAGPHSRIVEGRPVRLKAMTLAAAGRDEGPFRLRLTCPAAGR
ncbi:MAG: hypothetical protein ACK4NP_01250 [Parvularculaceae bacterium]